MDIRNKEEIVRKIIEKIKKESNVDADLFLPEVEKCFFIELMKMDEEVLKTKLEK